MTAAGLQQMSAADELRLMEALWVDLSRGEVDSPEWHGEILKERVRLTKEGREEFVDWEAAQRKLREELS